MHDLEQDHIGITLFHYTLETATGASRSTNFMTPWDYGATSPGFLVSPILKLPEYIRFEIIELDMLGGEMLQSHVI